ncbi:hypothetical protein DNTS_022604 [Danionella cerebrum]|uniref:Uncharacterized protein n=1 Tax=Danionella cerebrum TaxID=2873325 RepID=A0A553QA35_9TELE|nr:hypothetical protein DNTS_022604 [Danionella translucida]
MFKFIMCFLNASRSDTSTFPPLQTTEGWSLRWDGLPRSQQMMNFSVDEKCFIQPEDGWEMPLLLLLWGLFHIVPLTPGSLGNYSMN